MCECLFIVSLTYPSFLYIWIKQFLCWALSLTFALRKYIMQLSQRMDMVCEWENIIRVFCANESACIYLYIRDVCRYLQYRTLPARQGKSYYLACSICRECILGIGTNMFAILSYDRENYLGWTQSNTHTHMQSETGWMLKKNVWFTVCAWPRAKCVCTRSFVYLRLHNDMIGNLWVWQNQPCLQLPLISHPTN